MKKVHAACVAFGVALSVLLVLQSASGVGCYDPGESLVADAEARTDYVSWGTGPVYVAVNDTVHFRALDYTGEPSGMDQDTDRYEYPIDEALICNWDFGDGNGAQATVEPDHEYTSAGTYTVTLSVDDEAKYYPEDPPPDDTLTVHAFDVTVDAPASFPGYVCLGGSLDMGCTVTPGAAAGGAFSWSKVTGPGNATFTPNANAQNPTFSADAPGTYTVKVEYTKEGSTASDTSGGIVVFKVEIDAPDDFPAYLCLDGSLQLGCTVTPGAAAGGTFSWSKVSGPGNVTFTPNANAEDPAFSADQPGTYTVEVNYTKEGTTCSDIAGPIRAFVLTLYIDPGFSNSLTDWPASGDYPRSPKYVFGGNDPIYVRVEGIQADPTEQETISQAVKVTSESDSSGIYLTLKETGIDTNVFQNDLAAGELLYLSTSSDEGAGDKIEVLGEEVLTFAVKANGDYLFAKDVEVDRAEVGVEWQGDYGTYDTYPTINCADDFAQGFYNNLGTANLVWFKNFDNGDLNSKESHFKSTGDTQYADSVDIVVWCGHGPADTTAYMRFFVDLQDGQKQPADKLYWTEIAWGDKDVDWVVLNTCNFLDGTDAELKQMANGVHLILGYKTGMDVFCAAGEYFADQLESTNIRFAWFKQCKEYQESGRTARVFGASACLHDSFPTDGPIETSRDPIATSVYTHVDYTKP